MSDPEPTYDGPYYPPDDEFYDQDPSPYDGTYSED